MHTAPYRPSTAHLFVCVNRRAEGHPLGSGCAAYGEELFTALKQEVTCQGLVPSVWITRALCLGFCPKRGTAVAVYPTGVLLTEVTPEEAPILIQIVVKKRESP